MYINPPIWESAPEGPNFLVGSGGSDYKPTESANSLVPSQTPPPHTAPQCSHVGCPTLVNTLGSTPYYVTGAQRQKKKGQLKEQIKAPKKIQLSNDKMANLSDAQFKTLVSRMLSEMVEYGHKTEEKVKAMKK